MATSCRNYHKDSQPVSYPPAATKTSAPRGTGGPLPELHVPRIPAAAITIDGIPDEPAWRQATVVPLTNYWPGHPVAQRTLVRVLHTGDCLLVSFVCEDDVLIATHNARDDHTWRDDCTEIFLAAPVEGAPHEGLNIEINPAGYWADVLFRYPNWINPDWSPVDIRVASRATAPGWTVEVALPFAAIPDVSKVSGYGMIAGSSRQDFRLYESTLRASPPVRLRANFARWHRPENALTVWSDPQRPRPHALEFDRFGWLVFDTP
ncbi:protein of unknown function (DUF1083) [Opitutaceae bacterium TAV1]|nr:protein of unknown function (DUF1083) [Opitutaceae bacterium TAV1]